MCRFRLSYRNAQTNPRIGGHLRILQILIHYSARSRIALASNILAGAFVRAPVKTFQNSSAVAPLLPCVAITTIEAVSSPATDRRTRPYTNSTAWSKKTKAVKWEFPVNCFCFFGPPRYHGFAVG